MENNIGAIYQITAAIICIVLGLASIFFRRKMIELNIRQSSKHKDYMNQEITRQLSRPYMEYLAVIIGCGLVIGGVLTLSKFF